jgi:hypothetical protein
LGFRFAVVYCYWSEQRGWCTMGLNHFKIKSSFPLPSLFTKLSQSNITLDISKEILSFIIGIAGIVLWAFFYVYFDWILKEIGWFILDPQYDKKTYTDEEFEVKEKKAERIGNIVFLIFIFIIIITLILIT